MSDQVNLSLGAAAAVFEDDFMAQSLDQQVAHCDHYELVPFFMKWLPDNQPILEAGCGSGRWVAWFVKHGWLAAGLDWSETLCERARAAIPGIRFEVGDMRAMPFKDAEFGAIVSLGAVEHTPDGPMGSLREYSRLLRPGGIAIITVPYLGSVRMFGRLISIPRNAISHSKIIRRFLGKKIGTSTYHEAKQDTQKAYAADFMMTERGWEFYQYHFSKRQMQKFLEDAGLAIIDESVKFGDEGLLHTFGRLAGKYDHERDMVSLTAFGKILRKALPVDSMGHMLCYLVQRSP